MLPAIIERRSIRTYKSKEVSKELITEIIQAGILAPSSKNRQPWKFIVVTDPEKKDMLSAMAQGLQREKRQPLLPASAKYLNGAERTLDIMRQAPVVIFIVNTLGMDLLRPLRPEERVYEICNAQSIGAAIENMSITATELGLGSLWICDTYFAYQELRGWLGIDGELSAALAVGYADENPSSRPRKDLETAVEWRGYLGKPQQRG